MNGRQKASLDSRRILGGLAIAALLALAPMIAMAEEATTPDTSNDAVSAAVDTKTEAQAPLGDAARSLRTSLGNASKLQNFRPRDFDGMNMFEPPKSGTDKYQGQDVVWGFGFTQQFQGIRHANNAAPKMVTTAGVTTNANELIPIGKGFNNATANLYLDAQLARGIRLSLTSYLSSRHHQETWVKDGYLLVNASPIENGTLDAIMDVVSLRVGHFEINYGDQHFRRSDNGNAFFNPFVGNLLMDAFTTEIGAEVYANKAGFLAMGGITSGEIRGQVQKPNDRSPSYLAKVGFDKQLQQDLRVRLTGSYYTNKQAVSSTLYSGSRAGSRYYSVLENASSTETAQAWSGDIQPGFKNKVEAFVLNPFVKYQGFEFFGNIEQAQGRANTETSERIWRQWSGEGVYRFFDNQLYVGSRYNFARGNFQGIPNDLQVERIQTGGGWFVTKNILAKAEYVRQNYMNFPANDIKAGGHFDGFMVEGVVAF
jgi:hypothetical protein